MEKVLFVIDTLGGGGAEKVLVNTVNNLPRDKYDITVSTIFNSGIYIQHLKEHIKYKPLLKENKVNRILFWRLLKKLPRRLVYRMLINSKYDIEVAYIEGLSTILVSGSNNKQSKKICWVHTDLYNNYYNKKLFNGIQDNKNIYSKFDNIVCVSKDSRDGFINRFGENYRFTIIYNPIDTKDIIYKSKQEIDENLSKDKLRFITVGRLIEQKGYKRLLNIHKRLISEGLDYELLILGDGIQKKELIKYISDNDLQGTVKLLGFKSNPYKYMVRSDCFISSSYAEGYSLVVAEALVLGLPIISTRSSGPVELLDNGKYGLVVENSEEDLYYGIKKFILNEELRKDLKEKSKQRRNLFDLEKIISEVGGVLDE